MFNKYKASNLYLESSFFLFLILMQRIERIIWRFLNLVSSFLLAEIARRNYRRERPMKNFSSSAVDSASSLQTN